MQKNSINKYSQPFKKGFGLYSINTFDFLPLESISIDV